MTTKKDLLEQAKSLGLKSFWALRKDELSELITQALLGKAPAKYVNEKPQPPKNSQKPSSQKAPKKTEKIEVIRVCKSKLCDYFK